MNSPIPSYPKLLNMDDSGHPLLPEGTQVFIQEKIDGSQMSWWIDPNGGKLHIRSKGAVINPEEPPKQFAKAVETIKVVSWSVGYTFRAEAVSGNRHNVLTYSDPPEWGFVLFECHDKYRTRFYSCPTLGGRRCAEGFGYEAEWSLDLIQPQLDKPSVLGGMSEGFVVKPLEPIYDKHGHQVLFKYVRSEFREVAKRKPMKQSKTGAVVKDIVDMVSGPTRWHKAYQHLRDSGMLVGTMADIVTLVREVQNDVMAEEGDRISQELFKAFKWDILKHSVDGLAQWYKRKLETEE